MKKYLIILIVLIPGLLKAQPAALREQIASIARSVNGIVGVSVLGIEDRDTLNYNGNARLVLQSVMKFPIALAVLHYVDSGKLQLNQMIRIGKRDLNKDTFSPLRDKYPNGGADVSVGDLLGYMVSQSDNNACDILLKKIDGPNTVQDYMLKLGVKGISVRASEADMASSWEIQYLNWSKPAEMNVLLDKFYTGSILQKANTDFLLKLMTETTTGPKRIKGLLPAGTIVAHKTGSSGTNDAGLTPATNDVGIITLPNGKHLAISIFVCNSTSDEAAREAVIAKISKAVWDAHAR